MAACKTWRPEGCVPIQRTLGRPCGGNVPQSENVSVKGETFLVARPTASETFGMSATGTLPRNFRVRCKLFSRHQLARTSGCSRRRRAMCCVTRERTSGGSSMAMNVRTESGLLTTEDTEDHKKMKDIRALVSASASLLSPPQSRPW